MRRVTKPLGKALLCIAEGVHLTAQKQASLHDLAKQCPAVRLWSLQNEKVHVAVATLGAKGDGAKEERSGHSGEVPQRIANEAYRIRRGSHHEAESSP